MSLSLEESCKKYVAYVRRHKDCPTFENFNAKHYTNLPKDPQTYEYFSKQLAIAKKATGLPVTRRLPSLLKRFNNHFDPPQQAEPLASVQIRPPLKAVSAGFTRPIRQSIRSPEPIIPEHAIPEQASKEQVKETFEDYKERVMASKSILLQVKGGLLVHLVPENMSTEFEKDACKLTKNTWDTLRGKGDLPLKMRDGSLKDMSTIQLDQSDLALFINNRKKKIAGPYFIRYSQI